MGIFNEFVGEIFQLSRKPADVFIAKVAEINVEITQGRWKVGQYAGIEGWFCIHSEKSEIAREEFAVFRYEALDGLADLQVLKRGGQVRENRMVGDWAQTLEGEAVQLEARQVPEIFRRERAAVVSVRCVECAQRERQSIEDIGSPRLQGNFGRHRDGHIDQVGR